MRYLIAEGSDYKLPGSNGMTCMHLAAKSNNMQMLTYFKDLGLSIVEIDHKGATPLHWAAFLGCELTALTLISWSASVNCKDFAGLTPLHLAAINGNSQITRTLLLNGADPHVSDLKGRVPLDFARDYGFEKVIKALAEPGVLVSCGIRAPNRKMKSKGGLFLLYLVLMLAANLVYFFIVEVDEWGFWAVCAAQWVFTGFMACKDPGSASKFQKSLHELCQENEPGMVCPLCVAKRKPRMIHCQICDKCIVKFDHHCPWINNCIGSSNIGFFYFYIIFTDVFLTLSIYFGASFILAELEIGNLEDFIDFISEDWIDLDSIVEIIYISIAILGIIVELVFFVLVSLLIFIQTGNLISGRTTNERFNNYTEEDLENNPQEKTCINNCFDMFCNLNRAVTHQREIKERAVWKLEDIESDFKALLNS